VDRLVVMRTFSTVARSSTFSVAAAELGISPSLVSRHVADLEDQVGVRLVNRTPRSVTLTPAGVEYAAFSERILQDIEDADAQLTQSQDTAEGHLAIISPKWIGLMDLGTAIGAFIEEHPRTRIRFELGGISDRPYDFLDRGFDVAFHARDPRDSRVRVRRITELPFVLAGSADYLKRRGMPEEVSDLNTHELISHSNDTAWRLGRGEDLVHYKVQNPVVTTNAYLVIEQLVESGRGIGLIPRLSARRALESGSVVEVLPHLPPQPRSLYAVHRPGGQTPERVKVFLDFMTRWFRSREIS
jgi:DNA-binding transcriptional LysR family regulator